MKTEICARECVDRAWYTCNLQYQASLECRRNTSPWPWPPSCSSSWPWPRRLRSRRRSRLVITRNAINRLSVQRPSRVNRPTDNLPTHQKKNWVRGGVSPRKPKGTLTNTGHTHEHGTPALGLGPLINVDACAYLQKQFLVLIAARTRRPRCSTFSCFSFFSSLATCLATAPWIHWRRPPPCPAAACKAEVGWAA